MDAPPRGTITGPLLLMLALLASVAPFGIDLYLSAFPRMAADLHAGDSAIELTLTMFLLGLAAGQLAFGPLSDKMGRRGPLLIGSAAFVAASVLATFSPTITILLAARLVQGLSAAAGMVIGRAIIADLETGRAAARAFSLMMIVSSIAPVVAPLLGSLLVERIHWRGVLAVLTGLAILMLVGSAAIVRESLQREKRNTAKGGGFPLLRHRTYVSATATFVFSFSVMMAYIAASPFLYQTVIGVSTVSYGLLFALNAFGLVLSSAGASRLLRHGDPRRILALGVSCLLIASLTLLALALLPISPAWLPVPIFFAVSALGFILGPATAIALGAVPRATGTGSAVLGAAQFGLAALVSPLVSLGGPSALPMAITIAALAVMTVLSYAAFPRREPLNSPDTGRMAVTATQG